MSEQALNSKQSEINPRTARAVAAILSQTSTDEMLRGLNQSDGRNQSEQASFLGAESPHLRDIYERGGSIVDGVLTVPQENLSASPEIEITTVRAAVERLTRITKDSKKAKELAPKLVEMGTQIAGSHADGETRLKIFGWLYRTLEGKQELFESESPKNDSENLSIQSEAQFTEKWQQIVELSKSLAALEPKDRLPENSLEALGDNFHESDTAIEPDENSIAAEIYENGEAFENTEHAEEFVSGGALIGFERIEVGTDLPKIPENLIRSDFEKLLEKSSIIDSQLERGVPKREVLAPFKRYVELTRLDNELRLVEEEYAKVQTKNIVAPENAPPDYRFVAKSEELRELAEDRAMLDALREQKTKLSENIQKDFGENSENLDRAKVEQSLKKQHNSLRAEKIELTEDETELRQLLVKEKNIEHEIIDLSGSIAQRENSFRPFKELSTEEIPENRKQKLIGKIVSLELPITSVLQEKHPELTAQERTQKLNDANTFEIQNPTEYLFVRETATRHFQILRSREIKNEYQKFESLKLDATSDAKQARRELVQHQEKIQTLKTIEPVFAYKIEGSNRIVKAESSERAIAGYKFANDYIRYQLKQPETRARYESAIYREYASRLETAKNPKMLVRESYTIRQENHRAVGLWKNANLEERQKLSRPLSKNEMTLLFLEQPPKHYSGEMSVLKYNFAHYAQAKQRMTAALENGNLEPSAEATKLVESLEGRLSRRNLETKRQATKHFFESLKTENEKLVIKNEFDHSAVYQNLPPHEKDWVYARAQQQKENLEYKIIYEREKNIGLDLQPQTQAAQEKETATNLRQEFAAGTLWHQATKLTSHNSAKDFERVANLDEKTLETIGILIHNQNETNNLRVSEWLGKQKSDDSQMAGEILKTFAGAKREIENNQLKVTVKIAETNLISTADYQNLFERYFPTDFEKLKDFRFDKNENFRLQLSRRDGQSALLDTWKQEAGEAIYHGDAPVTVFENEWQNIKEIEKIKSAQVECRRANESKNAIFLKYEEKLKKEFAKNNRTVSEGDLQVVIERAFTPEQSGTLLPEQKAIFEKVQDKILSSDFERFRTSSKQIEAGISEINQSFEKIAELRAKNAQYLFVPEKTEKIESLQNQYEAKQQQWHAAQITSVARQKFKEITIDQQTNSDKSIIDYVSDEEREQARSESHREARIALEPAVLNEPQQQTSEIQTKAMEFADALEDAHQATLRGASESEITKAFNFAETKSEQLEITLKIEKDLQLLPENKPVTLIIYERELARNERAITQAKISNMIENGKLSLVDLETKKASEIFSAKERDEIRLEAGERTRENLEPKELWAKKQDVSEKLQDAALNASEALEKAHEIYHEANKNQDEVLRAFSTLDTGITRLKNERRSEKSASKFINFKTDFKRDLAQMFNHRQTVENPRLLAAMTKGLLFGALEKHNIQAEKIGIGGEKLSEISRTITLAVVDDKKREKMTAATKSAPFISQENYKEQDRSIAEKQNQTIKSKQHEYTR